MRDYFFVKEGTRIVKIKNEEVLYIQALADYVIFFCKGERKVLSHNTMKNLTEKLSEKEYMRIHRSYILNLQHLNEVNDDSVNVDGVVLPIGPKYRFDLMSRISTSMA